MPNLSMRGAFFLLLAACLPAPAAALPIFAHRYGFTCRQCHTTVPTLNAFGEYFLRNGFRLAGPAHGTMPMAVKFQTTYASGQGGDTDETQTSALPKAIVDEVELLSAGSIGRNASYYFEQYAVDGGFPGRPRDMWVDVNHPFAGDSAGPTVHSRIGEFTLPLPVDPETERPTLASYAVFDQSVGSNPFTLFDPRVGLDNYFTDDRHGLEAHLVLAQGVDAMGTVSKTIGNDLTAYAYRYQGQRNLGPIRDRFARDGYAVSYQHRKFELTTLVQQGNDTSADGYGLGALSSGGFMQAAWRFSDALNFYARYDDTYDPFKLRQGSAIASLVMRPAPNMRFTIEGSRQPNRTYQISGGLLFAY